MKKLIADFKAFAVKGNVIDMAIGVIIGAAFGKIVTSLVNDLLMPPIGAVLGKTDFKSYFVALNGTNYVNIDEARKAAAPVLAYGNFFQTVFDFIIVAFVIFMVLKKLLPLLIKEKQVAATTKDCPECLSKIPIGAKRCAHCTTLLPEPARA
jgi:large conductance mechanosensitive channel